MPKQDTNIANLYSESYQSTDSYECSVQEYLEDCRQDPSFYASAAERLLKAIGEAELIDTSRDPRLGRIMQNRTIRRYKAFEGFYGMEDTIENIVSYFRHSAQGLEESKQILYLLGPVGGGKSSLASKLIQLMEVEPFYTIKADGVYSPLYESPLGLFQTPKMQDIIENTYAIPRRYIPCVMSPWAIKRLDEFEGDISRFKVCRCFPSRLRQVAIARVEPGDENNQDISSLVGKVDIRQLEHFSQDDPDAYSYSGGLNRTCQGIMEFVEMFKAPVKVLHPLLVATQERSYRGTEDIGMLPFGGTILAHSNESEWQLFKNNKNNEAFIDRVCMVKVPYCLRVSEEASIYEKLLVNSHLKEAPCAPETLKILSRFSVLSRLKPHENSNLYSKMRVYDGEVLKDTDPKAKTVQEYRDVAGVDEGMALGIGPRFSFKVLSSTFNYDHEETAADPVHLMLVLEQAIRQEQFPSETENRYLDFIKSELAPRYADFIGKEIQKAYLESYSEFGQNYFDRYLSYADAWIENIDYKDPDTGQMFGRDILDAELSKVEKPAGIANPKDFRNEVVKFALRARADNKGKNPLWTSYEKLREVIERHMFSQVEDLLPVISFSTKKDSDTDSKHEEFVQRMIDHGYTARQVRRLVEWYMRVSKSG